MSEPRNLTWHSPGSRIVVSYSGEPDSYFERILGWRVGEVMCWVSMGGDSMLILEAAGSCDGTVQSGYPRSVGQMLPLNFRGHISSCVRDRIYAKLPQSSFDSFLFLLCFETVASWHRGVVAHRASSTEKLCL